MSKTNKSGKTKTKSGGGFAEATPVMFAMGHVDLIFSLNLTDKDLEKPDQNNEQNDGKKKEKKKINIIN